MKTTPTRRPLGGEKHVGDGVDVNLAGFDLIGKDAERESARELRRPIGRIAVHEHTRKLRNFSDPAPVRFLFEFDRQRHALRHYARPTSSSQRGRLGSDPAVPTRRESPNRLLLTIVRGERVVTLTRTSWCTGRCAWDSLRELAHPFVLPDEVAAQLFLNLEPIAPLAFVEPSLCRHHDSGPGVALQKDDRGSPDPRRFAARPAALRPASVATHTSKLSAASELGRLMPRVPAF